MQLINREKIMKAEVIISVLLISITLGGPIEDLAPGHWYEVPNSRLDAIDPEDNPVYNPNYPGNAPWHGVGGLRMIMGAWSGGTMDTERSRLLIWGGGHADYAGNEIYAFSLETLKWTMIAEPSINVGGSPESHLYPDGHPRSFHTHNYFTYVPGIDDFVSFGGLGPYPISAETKTVFSYHFDKNDWSVGAIPNVPNGSARGANAVYDPATHCVWHHGGAGGSHLNRYNVAANSWTTYAPSKYVNMYGTVALDPERRLLVLCGGSSGTQFLVWDLSQPNNPCFTPATSGDRRMEGENAPGFEFDPVIKKFVAWDGGASVYTIDPDTWYWGRISPANNVTPTAACKTGTYGRFRYVPAKNVYVAVNATNENVYICRLTHGTGVTRKESGIWKPAAQIPDRVQVYNIVGRLIETRRIDRPGFVWQGSDQRAGLYILRFWAGNKKWSKKIVVQK
jgi:hypothetical protein